MRTSASQQRGRTANREGGQPTEREDSQQGGKTANREGGQPTEREDRAITGAILITCPLLVVT